MHMVLNLLDNGIKYNRPGGTVMLTNEVKQDEHGHDRMIIKVSDTGIGIPDDARERIFDPFYTVSSDRSRVHGGTGLGLSLVRNLAEKQHGSVQLAESGPGGSTFVIVLPMNRPQSTEVISTEESSDLE